MTVTEAAFPCDFRAKKERRGQSLSSKERTDERETTHLVENLEQPRLTDESTTGRDGSDDFEVLLSVKKLGGAEVGNEVEGDGSSGGELRDDSEGWESLRREERRRKGQTSSSTSGERKERTEKASSCS